MDSIHIEGIMRLAEDRILNRLKQIYSEDDPRLEAYQRGMHDAFHEIGSRLLRDGWRPR